MSKLDPSKQYRPSKRNPELFDLVVDIISFNRKWTTRKLADLLGVTRQSLEAHVQKRKEKTK